MSLPTQQDAMGGPITADMTIFATVRASIEALTGRELYSAQQMVAQVTHRVTIRWMAGVKSRMVVWFTENIGSPATSLTRQFQILDVQNPDEKHHLLWLMCMERDESAYEFPEAQPQPYVPVTPVYYGKLAIAGVMNGVNTVFTLPFTPPLPGNLVVFINGLEVNAGDDYQLSGATLTTIIAPSQINVYYF
jgi:SPP1 family predicted phage head-tail adaptor